MAGKNKGGREARKPRQEQNKGAKGRPPSRTAPALDATNQTVRRPKK